MEQSTNRSVSGIRRFRVLVVALVVVVVVFGVAIAIHAWSANSGLMMPSTGAVTVTGYGASSPENPSTEPHSVVLTDSQAATLRSQFSAIPTLPSRSLTCMENETVFKIVVKSAQRSAGTVWIAHAELCPAPGFLHIYGKDAGKPKIARYCTLKRLMLSYFPKGTVNGTRSGLRFC